MEIGKVERNHFFHFEIKKLKEFFFWNWKVERIFVFFSEIEKLKELAECSVCQFVKSNCLIGFDWGDAWFGASWGNSKWISTSSDKLPQILRIHHRLGKGFTWLGWVVYDQRWNTIRNAFRKIQWVRNLMRNYLSLATTLTDWGASL